MRILALLLAAASLAVVSTAISAPPATTQSAADPLEQAIASLRARKLPATFADLAPTPVPDDKNAALDIDEAAVMTSGNEGGPSSSSLDYPDQLPYPKEWFDLARPNAIANSEAAALLHSARIKAAIAWPNPPTAPLDDWMRSGKYGLAKYRQLANVSGDIALLQHFSGEEAQAIESLRDLGFLGQAVSQKPFFVAKLVGLGILAKQTHDTQVIAAGLKIKPLADPEGAAQRAAVKALIADLLDDAKLQNAYRRGIQEERTIVIEAVMGGDAASLALIEELRGGDPSPATLPSADLLSKIPVYDLDAFAIDKHPWEKVATDQRNRQTFAFVRNGVWREITLRRMAAVSLACALYRNDHNAYPADLAGLVPDYLEKIPADPFARDGANLRYAIVDNGTRPLIGTVGPDGQPTAPGLYKKTAYGQYYVKDGPDDIWLDLSPWQEH